MNLNIVVKKDVELDKEELQKQIFMTVIDICKRYLEISINNINISYKYSIQYFELKHKNIDNYLTVRKIKINNKMTEICFCYLK